MNSAKPPPRSAQLGVSSDTSDGNFLRVGHSVGLDANLPVLGDGTLSHQVGDPRIIAGTNVGWVRLNFVLGPWSSVWDRSLHAGRTWQTTYSHIIEGFRRYGLKIYALIGAEAVKPSDFRNIYRDPPAGDVVTDAWIEAYVDTFVGVLHMFSADVQMVESINEPDDYHGGTVNRIHPEWFAIMLQRLYEKVRSHSELSHIKIVSGPLQGLDTNNNAGVRYLRATYRAGMRRFKWGGGETPFPFDSVAYHLYVEEGLKDWPAQEEAIRRKYGQYLSELKRTIHEMEGAPKSICVSEFGWHSNGGREELQKRSVPLGVSLLHDEPSVTNLLVFCTQDFGPENSSKFYGLYRQDGLAFWHRKPVYYTFRRLCSRPAMENSIPARMPPSGITYGDLINSLHVVSNSLGQEDWDLTLRAGTDVYGLIRRRNNECPAHAIANSLRLSHQELQMLVDELHAVKRMAGALPQDPDYIGQMPAMTITPLSPPLPLRISPDKALSNLELRAIEAWNRDGYLLLRIADRLALPVAVVVGVFARLSDLSGFEADGTMTIRFETHIFYAEWGRAHRSLFNRHFRLDGGNLLSNHWFRRHVDAPWINVHASHQTERMAFELAHALDRSAAFAALRMGIPRILGYDSSLVGYGSAQDMYFALASSRRAQILALFDLIAGSKQSSTELQALQHSRYADFVTRELRTHEGMSRTSGLQAAVDAFQRWDPLGSY